MIQDGTSTLSTTHTFILFPHRPSFLSALPPTQGTPTYPTSPIIDDPRMTMEINKDEALRCLSIAKNHYGSGNYAAATRFARKSIKLYPTDEAKSFLEKAERSAADEPVGTSTATSSSSSSPMNGSTTKTASSSSTPSSDKKHTKEQAEAVKRILSCGTDYYKVLSLEKDCTEVQIKKSYRKVWVVCTHEW